MQDLFAAMASDSRIDLQVLYMEQVAPDTHWGVQEMPSYAQVLPGRWLGFSGARIHLNPTVRKELDQHDADLVVVVGYVGLTNQLAIRHLEKHNRRWAFWGEIPGLHKRGLLGSWLRKIAQRPLAKAAGIAAVGSHALKVYQLLTTGRAAKQQFFTNIPYHCDIGPFQAAASNRVEAKTVRFLYCGQLIHRKGVDLLCSAFTKLIDDGVNATLTLAGEGALRESLEASMSPMVRDKVKLHGFLPVTQLPEIFAMCDVFVIPSRHDGWGVVVNQAIAAGMPVIASEAVGAANDLIEIGVNGMVVTAGDANSLYSAMKDVCQSEDRRNRMSQASAEKAASLSLPAAVSDWVAFFNGCLATRE